MSASAVYSDNVLIDLIAEKLSQYQEILISRVASGRTQDQSIEPTMILSIDELKTLTGRRRGRQAFIEAFIEGLEEKGLSVERLKHNRFAVTKPADNLPTEFDSFEEFSELYDEVISELELEQEEAA